MPQLILPQWYDAQPQETSEVNYEFPVHAVFLPGQGFIGERAVPHSVAIGASGQALTSLATLSPTTITSVDNRSTFTIILQLTRSPLASGNIALVDGGGFGWRLSGDHWDNDNFRISLSGQWSGAGMGLNVPMKAGETKTVAIECTLTASSADIVVRMPDGTSVSATQASALEPDRSSSIGNLSFSGSTHPVYIGAYLRGVNPEQSKLLLENPWRLFEAPPLVLSVSAGAPAGVTGSVAWTEQDDTASISATATVSGAAGWTEANDTTAVSGNVGSDVAGAAAWTEADDAVAIQANVALPAAGSIAWTEQDDTTAIAAQSDAAGQPMIGGGGAGPSRRKIEDFLKSLEPKERKKPRKKKRKQAAVVELAPFDPQELAFVEEQIAPPSDIELLLAQSMPVQVPPLYSAPAAIEQMLMQHRMHQQQQAQTEEDRIIELLLLI